MGVGLVVGWDWLQESTVPRNTATLSGRQSIKFNIYSQQQADLAFELNATDIFRMRPAAQIARFRVDFTNGLNYFYDSGRACFFGYLDATDDTSVAITLVIQMIEFSKNIVENFWTLDNWISNEARLLDRV